MSTASQVSAASQNDLLEGEDVDIRQEVAKIVPDPDLWLDMPNDQLGGRRPRDLIGTPEERHLRHLIRAIKLGFAT